MALKAASIGLTPAEKKQLVKKLEQQEGRVNHMYLDSKGLVTVGVGHLLATVGSAQRLPFIYRGMMKLARTVDILNEYQSLKKLPPNKNASYYKRYTTLIIAESIIDRERDNHIRNFYTELKQSYPDFDKFPAEAKLALFDMIFNLGKTELTNIKKWPKFNAAILAKDWLKAAAESKRKHPVAPARNKYVRDLFTNAAKKANSP